VRTEVDKGSPKNDTNFHAQALKSLHSNISIEKEKIIINTTHGLTSQTIFKTEREKRGHQFCTVKRTPMRREKRAKLKPYELMLSIN